MLHWFRSSLYASLFLHIAYWVFLWRMVSPSLLCFTLLIPVLLRRLLLYVFLVFLLLHFIYFFQSLLNYCHFPSSFYTPTFDLVLLSRLLPLSSVSDHHLTLVFLLFPFFVFSSSYRPSPIFSGLLSTSTHIPFSYSFLFCLITCLFSTCFLFIILLFLLSFLVCIWSLILLSFRVHIDDLSLRAPSPWSNDRFLWLRWWMLCCLLSALSNSDIKVLM